MILQSLCRYYDVLAGDPGVKIPRLGYSTAKVSFALALSPDGEVANIVDLRTTDKKPRPREVDVPLQRSRANGVIPYFASDNAKYVFGVERMKRSEFERKGLDRPVEGNTLLRESDAEVVLVYKRSRECFMEFRALHHRVLDTLDDPGARCFLKFLDTWEPEKFLEHPKIVEYEDDILSGVNFVFECGGSCLHRNGAVRRAWEDYLSARADEEGYVARCLVSGRFGPVSRLHQKIKGVAGAQMAGASLVSFNDDAFCSYGKEQSFNAPVSEPAMFKYTTVLNHLLASLDNRLMIGDATTVFWAETRNRNCEDLVRFLIDPRDERGDDEEGGSAGTVGQQDKKKIQQVGDILNKVRIGGHLNRDDIGEDPDTNFFILGLSPNNARLAIRFWHVDSFGTFVARVARHHLDMEVVRSDFDPHYVSVYRLLKETVPQGSDAKAVSPLLGGLLMRSILCNTPYPVQMYGAILNRVRVEGRINFARAGFIKAYLLRLSRVGSMSFKEDLITMSLNEESPNVPYRLGRLFAVLEKTQSDTNRDLKSTITSKYFSSASSTPAVVFPVLLKLAQHHIAKSDWGARSSRSIEEILTGVDAFPAYLSLEEQGLFMLGYYHQRRANFRKKEDVSREVE